MTRVAPIVLYVLYLLVLVYRVQQKEGKDSLGGGYQSNSRQSLSNGWRRDKEKRREKEVWGRPPRICRNDLSWEKLHTARTRREASESQVPRSPIWGGVGGLFSRRPICAARAAGDGPKGF